MPFPHALTVSRPRLLLTAMVVLATLAVASIATPSDAAASSGGIGTTDSTGTGGESTSSNISQARYDRLWNRVLPVNKRWARSTSTCESGNDPDAIGGGGTYRGAFQFTKRTWASSPKTPGGDPIDYSYRTQAVVAVYLKLRDGSSPWPVCG